MSRLDDFMQVMIGDASPEDRSRLLKMAFRIVVAVHIVWACGLLAPMGLSGFVFADEVDDKIQSAVEPIRSELGNITRKLETGEQIQKRILTGQIAAQLRDLNRLRCSTSDEHVRMRMERDIDDAQQEYRMLTGERYPLASCHNL